MVPKRLARGWQAGAAPHSHDMHCGNNECHVVAAAQHMGGARAKTMHAESKPTLCAHRRLCGLHKRTRRAPSPERRRPVAVRSPHTTKDAQQQC